MTSSTNLSSNLSPNAQELVILVHGFFGSRLDMLLLARHLRKSGFKTFTFTYSSLRTRIPKIADRLAAKLKQIENDNSIRRVHLVTHSMGGIVTRAAFANQVFNKANRIVTLTPPNRGSHMARRLGGLLEWICPSLKEISDRESSYVNSLGTFESNPQVELGIVRSLKDRVIAQDCVAMNGCREMHDLPIHHGMITWYPQVARLVESFLLHGTFEPRS